MHTLLQRRTGAGRARDTGAAPAGPSASAAASGPGDRRAVVLFDGGCVLCDGAVRWLIRRDPAGRLAYASLGSPVAKVLLAGHQTTEELGGRAGTLVLLDAAGLHTRSTAVLRIAGHLGLPWSLARVGRWVPRPLRDAVYDLVARHRERWFGRSDRCLAPTPETADRFLDGAGGSPGGSEGAGAAGGRDE